MIIFCFLSTAQRLLLIYGRDARKYMPVYDLNNARRTEPFGKRSGSMKKALHLHTVSVFCWRRRRQAIFCTHTHTFLTTFFTPISDSQHHHHCCRCEMQTRTLMPCLLAASSRHFVSKQTNAVFGCQSDMTVVLWRFNCRDEQLLITHRLTLTIICRQRSLIWNLW